MTRTGQASGESRGLYRGMQWNRRLADKKELQDDIKKATDANRCDPKAAARDSEYLEVKIKPVQEQKESLHARDMGKGQCTGAWNCDIS